MGTFRVSVSADGSTLVKVLRNTTLERAKQKTESEVRFLSLMPLDIPNREVEWKIEMKGRGDGWHTILAGYAKAL